MALVCFHCCASASGELCAQFLSEPSEGLPTSRSLEAGVSERAPPPALVTGDAGAAASVIMGTNTVICRTFVIWIKQKRRY